jgi:hypothetical protein
MQAAEVRNYMTDITTTSFGLIIAYLVPGFAGLYALAFWFSGVRKLFDTFVTTTAQSAVGPFLVVLIAALLIGLVVNSLRWAIFEWGRPDVLQPVDLRELAKDRLLLDVFLTRIDENFRHYQYGGNMAVVLPTLYVGWLRTSWSDLGCLPKGLSLLVFLALELVTVFYALAGRHRFEERSRALLENKSHLERENPPPPPASSN